MSFWMSPRRKQQQQQQQQEEEEEEDQDGDEYAGYYDSGSGPDGSSHSEEDASHNGNVRRHPREYQSEDSDEDISRHEGVAPLSPHCPPPTLNVFQHSNTPRDHHQSPATITAQQRPLDSALQPSFPGLHETDDPCSEGPASITVALPPSFQYQKSPLDHLTRRRPLDPVFKASEGTFPLLVEEDPTLNNTRMTSSSYDSNGMIKIFDPSANTSMRSLLSESKDDDDDDDPMRTVSEAQQQQQSDETHEVDTQIDTHSSERSGSIEREVEQGRNIDEAPSPSSYTRYIEDLQEANEDYVVVDDLLPPYISSSQILQDDDSDVTPEEPVAPEMTAQDDDADNTLGDAEEDDEQAETAQREEEVLVEYGDVRGTISQIEGEHDREEHGDAADRGKKKTTIDAGFVLETPDRPIKQSRFVFLSDRKEVPTDLKKLQEKTLKRRRDLLARMHDLDCQVAKMASKYAEEKMDLDLAISDTFDRTVCHPLEAAAERLGMERETSANRAPAVASLERRLSRLDNLMTHHVHVTLNDAKREELDSLQDDLQQDIIPGIRIENSKFDKIEGGVVRRFENVAGMVARRFHEESAARRAAVELMTRKIQASACQDEERLDDVLAVITEVRVKIRRERAERKAADQKILEEIVNTTVSMKYALLQAVGEGN
jgi:hypothetical protein